MSEWIGGIVGGLGMATLLMTIDLWKFSPVRDIFTLLLSITFWVGSIGTGVLIAKWLKDNDTTISY